MRFRYRWGSGRWATVTTGARTAREAWLSVLRLNPDRAKMVDEGQLTFELEELRSKPGRPPNRKPSVTLHIRISGEFHRELERLAAKESGPLKEYTVSEIARRAMAEVLEAGGLAK